MTRWKQHLLAAPGVAVSLLPKFACPICASASVGILSSVGLGYLLSATYLLPLTVALLLVALAALAFRARTRQGYGPLFLGTAAAAGVLLGKFQWDSTPTLYAAVSLLVLSSFWNGWPPPATLGATAACPACESEASPIEAKGD